VGLKNGEITFAICLADNRQRDILRQHWCHATRSLAWLTKPRLFVYGDGCRPQRQQQMPQLPVVENRRNVAQRSIVVVRVCLGGGRHGQRDYVSDELHQLVTRRTELSRR